MVVLAGQQAFVVDGWRMIREQNPRRAARNLAMHRSGGSPPAGINRFQEEIEHFTNSLAEGHKQITWYFSLPVNAGARKLRRKAASLTRRVWRPRWIGGGGVMKFDWLLAHYAGRQHLRNSIRRLSVSI